MSARPQSAIGVCLLVIGTAPWIVLPAIAGEAFQHSVEFAFGMYVRGDGISIGHEANVRGFAAAVKIVGFLSTLALARARDRRMADRQPIPMAAKAVAIALPVMLHYVLNYAAVGKPDWIVLAMISLDCVVIGWLALTIGLVLQARREAE